MSSVQRIGPASYAQEALWLAAQARPDLPVFNSAFALHLRGPLDVPSLAGALTGIVARHESLRSTVRLAGDRLVQLVGPAPADLLTVVDCPESAVPAEAAALASELFDLDRGPLLRLRLLRCSAGYAVLVLVVHHLTWDAGSMRVFLDELVDGYLAGITATPDPGTAAPVQYIDHAARERAELTGARLDRHLGYFRDRLADLPEFLDLPTDRPRPAVRNLAGAVEPIEFDAATTAGVRALAHAERTTLASVLLAGVQTTLARYAGTEDVPVGMASSARPRADLEPLIGCFVNPLVLRQRVTARQSPRELVRANRRDIARCLDHRELPFDRLVRDLAPHRSTSHHPLFQVMFASQQRPARHRQLGPVRLSVTQLGKGVAKFDLSFVLEAAPDEPIGGLLSYSTELFEPATARHLVSYLGRLLGAAVAEPDRAIGRLPILRPAEEAALLAAGPNPAGAAGPPDDVVDDVAALFAAQVARAPDAVAVVDAATGATVSYRRLGAAVGAIAARLSKAGVPPEGVVAVAMDLGVGAAAAALGTLRAGAGFFFLTSDYPAALCRQLITTQRAVAVLTTRAGAARLTGIAPPLLIIDDEQIHDGRVDDEHVDDERVDDEAAGFGTPGGFGWSGGHPDRLACVSFTSGSTGAPKGVSLTHRGIAGYLRAVAAEQGLTGADRMVWKANLAFDAAVAELFQPLLLGATAVLLAERDRVEPAALAAALARHRITVIGLPAAMLRALAAQPGLAGCTALRLVSSGGEAMQSAVVGAFVARSTARLVNRYGPSEASIAVTSFEATGWRGSGPVPLGRARAGARVCVLDRRRRITPVGVVGELFVGGAALARGYAGQPGATARVFTPDPYVPGERLYATGDRGRYRPDGTIEFLGRGDAQVKIRGVRIEPAAIAATLQADATVRAAVVTVHDDPSGDPDRRVLVAHVEPVDPARCDPVRLRAVLVEALPAHLVPAVVQVRDRLPRTRAGKVDVRALATGPLVLAGADRSVPGTVTEIRLAAIWAQLLGRQPIPAATSFFALGGHSLLAMRLVSQVQEELGRQLRLRDVLAAPTVGQLAALVDAMAAGPAAEPIAPSRRRAASRTPQRKTLE